MTTTYNTAAGNARLVAGLTAAVPGQSVDGQGSPGLLVIGTNALSGATGVLATITLQLPSFTISNKVATLAGTPLTTSATGTGTAAKAELRDSSSNTIISGLTVGVSGTDITVNNTSVVNALNVTCTAGTITTQ